MKGTILFNYTLKSLLGRGGMAEVWYAENNLGKPAAIKIMLPKFLGEFHVVTRFESEARAIVQLNHPNIRQVMDYGEYKGRPFIIMEYLEGKDLGQLLNSGHTFSDTELKRYWKQCVSALKHTHSKGIIHRDIKPSNIFLQKSGNVKILDFGIAKVKDEIYITRTGQRLGTILYMSPEQVKDPKRVTVATDIYSLGVTFAHLLKGKAPFVITDDDSGFNIQLKIVKGELDYSGIEKGWKNKLIKATTLIPHKRELSSTFAPKEIRPRKQKKKKEKKSNGWAFVVGLFIVGLFIYLMEVESQSNSRISQGAIKPYSMKDLYGYKMGDSIIIEPQFHGAGYFKDNRALVRRNDSLFYIDIYGKMVEFVKIEKREKTKLEILSENMKSLLENPPTYEQESGETDKASKEFQELLKNNLIKSGTIERLPQKDIKLPVEQDLKPTTETKNEVRN